MMELPSSDDIYSLKVDDFDTAKLLTNAARQRDERGLGDVFIVDADSHHYETESVAELLEYIEDPVMKQLSRSALGVARKSRGFPYSRVGYQDVGGRITREPLRQMEKTIPDGNHRDVQLALKRMDTMGIDISVLLPTPMMLLGMHPQAEFEAQVALAYNRWLVEKVLSGSNRLKSFAYLPFNDPEMAYRIVQEFKDVPGIIGFLVTSVRSNAVHENVYAKTYAAIQEAGKVLSFHTGYDWDDPTFGSPSRFVAVQARLSFLQCRALCELAVQRHERALSGLKSSVDGGRSRLGALGDPADRFRIPDEIVGGARSQEAPE